MIPRALAAAAVLALLAPLFAFKAASKMADFEVYWRGGTRALAGEALYRQEDGHYQLKYLPAFAILSIPAALLPLSTAKAVWFISSAALIGVLLTLSLGLLPERRRPPWVVIAVAFIAMAKFYGHELILGQVNLLLGAVVVLAVHLIAAHRAAAAGLLIALAVIVKPYAIIFVPWLAAHRAMRALATASAGIAAALLLPTVVYGLEGTVALHRDWWRTVTESTAPNLLNPDNVSLAAMFAKWMGPGAAAAWLAGIASAVLLLAAAIAFGLRRRVVSPAGLEAAMLLALIPLLSPQGWDYVFLLATPAVLFVVNYDRELPPALRTLTWTALAVAGLTIYDVVGRAAYGTFMRLSLVSVCFLVVIAALVALRIRRIA